MAGHRVEIDPATSVQRITAVSAESAVAGRAGRLEYISKPLKYVVADVNRYSDARITIGDAEIGELLITGTVLEADIDGWLRSLEEFLAAQGAADGRERGIRALFRGQSDQ